VAACASPEPASSNGTAAPPINAERRVISTPVPPQHPGRRI
jgi:hypothetical protein